jgi:hypothetical protein
MPVHQLQKIQHARLRDMYSFKAEISLRERIERMTTAGNPN